MNGINVSIMKEIKNKIEHNEGILREIQNRIMKEIWSRIPTSLITSDTLAIYIAICIISATRHTYFRYVQILLSILTTCIILQYSSMCLFLVLHIYACV